MLFSQLKQSKIASYDAIILLQNRFRFRLIIGVLKNMKQSKEHIEAKNAVENLKNHDSTIYTRLNNYIQYLGINPDNLDLDQVIEDIKNVNGK